MFSTTAPLRKLSVKSSLIALFSLALFVFLLPFALFFFIGFTALTLIVMKLKGSSFKQPRFNFQRQGFNFQRSQAKKREEVVFTAEKGKDYTVS